MTEQKNKIILEAETKFVDTEIRDLFSKLCSKVDTINERTKQHTLEIRNMKKQLEEMLIQLKGGVKNE